MSSSLAPVSPQVSPCVSYDLSSPYTFGQPPPPAGSVLNAADAPTEQDKPHALVVDDAPDVTEMIALLLKYAGYNVTSANSGAQALAAARTAQFDALISDIGMPGMNGYELAAHVRALPGYERVPMIAVTGYTMYDDRDRALASGFNAFLTKPISPSDLIKTLAGLRG